MKRTIAFAAFALLLLARTASAQGLIYQRVPFGSTPNPVGSGARAVAWGGAFIAVADDATAASWNPAGLVQLIEPEASVALTYHSRVEQFAFSGYSTEADSLSSSGGNLNYASVVYPFHVGEVNMVASLNYQRLYEFDRRLEYTATGVNSFGDNFIAKRKFDQSGALSTVTPAFAVQITPALSIGLAVNFWGLEPMGDGWEQQFQIEQVLNPGTPNEIHSWSENQESYDFSGTNFVVGAHFKITNFTIGAVYKSSFVAKVRYESENEYSQFAPFQPNLNYTQFFDQDEDESLTWPESFGVGVAYRFSDRFSIAMDAYTTLWSRYQLETDDGDLNLITGDESTDVVDTWQVRLGAEYLWVQPKYVAALRGGFFYDPEPMSDGHMDYYGAAVGGGIVYQNFVIDAAFQYRQANDIEGERVENVRAESDNQDYFGIVSLIYHF